MMTKRIFSALLAAALSLSLLAGCGSTSGSTASSAADGPQRYSTVFYDVFDTVTQVIAYCDSEEEFTAQMDALHADLVEYNQLYDIYNDYDGVTNIKTINDNAGIAPVTVDDKILGMLELAQTMYDTTGGKLNIALEGRLDTNTAPQLEAELKRSVSGVTELVLDFTGLEYISSAGLRVLLAAQKVMNKQGKMVLRGVNSTITEVLEITGFVDILTVEE